MQHDEWTSMVKLYNGVANILEVDSGNEIRHSHVKLDRFVSYHLTYSHCMLK